MGNNQGGNNRKSNNYGTNNLKKEKKRIGIAISTERNVAGAIPGATTIPMVIITITTVAALLVGEQ